VQRCGNMKLPAFPILVLVLVATLAPTVLQAGRADDKLTDKPKQTVSKTATVPAPVTVTLIVLVLGGMVARQVHQWRRPNRGRKEGDETWV
jgi:hypothetical protein